VFVPTGFVGDGRPLPHDQLYGLLQRAEHRRLRVVAAEAPRAVQRVVARAGLQESSLSLPALVDQLIARCPALVLSQLGDALEDWLGEAPVLDEGAQVMDAEELRACAETGFELGAHTVGHTVLVHEPWPRVRAELERPRAILESLSGMPCRSFAYCNGLHTPSVRRAVAEAGYDTAVTVAPRANRPGDDPYALGRTLLWEGAVSAFGRYSPALAAAELHGVFAPLSRLREARAQRARQAQVPPSPQGGRGRKWA